MNDASQTTETKTPKSLETPEQFQERMRADYSDVLKSDDLVNLTTPQDMVLAELRAAAAATGLIEPGPSLAIGGFTVVPEATEAPTKLIDWSALPNIMGSGYTAEPLKFDALTRTLRAVDPGYDPVLDDFAKMEVEARTVVLGSVLVTNADNPQKLRIARSMAKIIMAEGHDATERSKFAIFLYERLMPVAALVDDSQSSLQARALLWILRYREACLANDMIWIKKSVFAIARLVEISRAKTKIEPLAIKEKTRADVFKAEGNAANKERAIEADTAPRELANVIKAQVNTHQNMSTKVLAKFATKNIEGLSGGVSVWNVREMRRKGYLPPKKN